MLSPVAAPRSAASFAPAEARTRTGNWKTWGLGLLVAAIIGGVSLAGGKGTPIGIAGGVLVLAVLRSGLTAIGVPPFAHDIVTGGVLLAVALLDAGDLQRRLHGLRRTFRA